VPRSIGAVGYRAFVPKPLPPDPPLSIDDELWALNSRADQTLGRLAATADYVPNPDLFVFQYAFREAVLSSQIEGTQSSLDDLLRIEASMKAASPVEDQQETLNYVRAMNLGVSALKDGPLTLALIQETHAALMAGVRGQDKSPGQFRRTQNWIGPADCLLQNAFFVPPPPELVPDLLAGLEWFVQTTTSLPPLVVAALAHAHFETIHPFSDGNGRVGRLLIMFLLLQRGVLPRPLLYPSLYLKRHRATYYERLQNVRTQGDWENWVKFFLRAVRVAAEDAYLRTKAIMELRERDRYRVLEPGGAASLGVARALDQLYESPYTSAAHLAGSIGVSPDTGARIIKRLEELAILSEITGAKRDRVYRYEDYHRVLQQESYVDGE
jgi:Fic family protein